MGDKVFEQVTEYIDAMANKLGIASEYVFEVLVRQQIVAGTVGMIVGLVLLALAISIICVTIKSYGTSDYRRLDDGDLVRNKGLMFGLKEFLEDGGMVIVVGVALILVTISFIAIPSSFTMLLNPEYYAIEEILDTIKGGD